MTNTTKVPLIRIIGSFFKTGVLGFGGGPSVIPLIKADVVEGYRWMEDEKFSQLFSIANILPGPIATKVAAYVGYELRGVAGLLSAVLAHILPSGFAIVAIIAMVNGFADSPIVQGMIKAVIPVVAVMLGLMAYEFMQKTWKGLGIAGAIVTFSIVLVLLELVQLHSALVIGLFIVLGMFYPRFSIYLRKKKEG